MHAVRLHQFGPAENLVLDEVPDPEPGPGQVRIAVGAAGVHVLDTFIRAGESGGPFPLPELPTVPGREVAGIVDRVGPEVDPSWLDRRVVAHLGMASGGYAELALAPEAALHDIPSGMDDELAVAMIGTGRTAFGIAEAAAVTADDVVLVTAAAGGRKVDVARCLGAQIGVDYENDGWTDDVRRALGGRDVSVVLLAVGGALGEGALSLLGDGGRAVVYGWSGGDPVALTDEQVARGVTVIDDLGKRIMGRPGGMRNLETMALAAAGRGDLQPL